MNEPIHSVLGIMPKGCSSVTHVQTPPRGFCSAAFRQCRWQVHTTAVPTSCHRGAHRVSQVPGGKQTISPSISILPALAACYLGVYETLAFCKPEILWQDTASQVLISLAGNKSLGYLYLHYQLHLQSSARTSWRAAASNPPCFLSFCASPAWAGQAFAGGEIRQAAQGEMWIKTTSPCWGRRNHTWPWSQSGQGNMLDFGWHRDVKSL